MTAAERARRLRESGLRRSADDVPALLEGLVDPAPIVRAAACRALSWQRDPALARPLSARLADIDPTVRLAAVRGLAVCLGPDGPASAAIVAALSERLADEVAEVRAAAARVCGWLAVTGCTDAIRQLLRDDPAPGVRAEAAHAAGRLGDLDAVPALLAALTAPHGGLRHHAARALGVLRAGGATAALRARLSDPDAEVRVAALRAVVGLTDDPAPIDDALSDENPGVRATAALLAGPCAALPTARLSAALAGEAHPEVRGHLLRALVERGASS